MQTQAGYQANRMVGDQCYPAFELRSLLEFIHEHLGEQTVETLCQQIGLGLAELNSVPFVYVWQVEYVLEALRLQSTEPDIGARLGASHQVANLDILLPHLENFSDLNQCFKFVVEHPELVGSFSDSLLRIEGDLLWCRWVNTGKVSLNKYGFQFQHSVCSLVSLARQLSKQPITLSHIRLAQLQASHPFLSEFTGAELEFDCDYFEWSIDLRSLEAPLIYTFKPHSADIDYVASSSFIEKTICAIRKQFPAAPTLKQMAQQQHMSDRTLRRKLAAAGSSYQRLLDQVRCQQAVKLILENSLTIDEISTLMGYSDPSHFRQSFKHWLGYPPGHFFRLNRLSSQSKVD